MVSTYTWLEGSSCLLNGMSKESSDEAYKYLTEFGVNVKLDSLVSNYDGWYLTRSDGSSLHAKKVVWAAGVTGNTIEGLPPESYGPGRNRAVVDLPHGKFQGTFAWYVWLFVHLLQLIGFKNRILFSWTGSGITLLMTNHSVLLSSRESHPRLGSNALSSKILSDNLFYLIEVTLAKVLALSKH